MSEQQLQRTELKRDIRSLIQSDGVKEQLALVLPKHMTPFLPLNNKQPIV